MQTAPRTGRAGEVLGIASVIALDITMVYLVSIHQTDEWAAFFTLMTLFLVAEGFATIYDYILGGRGSDFTIPVEFSLFCLLIFYSHDAGIYLVNTILQAFNSVTPLAYLVFFVISTVPSALLYKVFLSRRDIRLARHWYGRSPEHTS